MKRYTHAEVEQLCREAYGELTHIYGRIPMEEAAKAYDKLSDSERIKITSVVERVLHTIALEEEKEQERREVGLRELTRISQEMGLYD